MKASSFDLWSPVRILTALISALTILFVGFFIAGRAASFVPPGDLSRLVFLIVYLPFLGGMFYFLFWQRSRSADALGKTELRYVLSAETLKIETKPTAQQFRNADVREISRSILRNKINVTVGGYPVSFPARVEVIEPEGAGGGMGAYGLAVHNDKLVIKFWSNQTNEGLVDEVLPY